MSFHFVCDLHGTYSALNSSAVCPRCAGPALHAQGDRPFMRLDELRVEIEHLRSENARLNAEKVDACQGYLAMVEKAVALGAALRGADKSLADLLGLHMRPEGWSEDARLSAVRVALGARNVARAALAEEGRDDGT